MMDPGLLHPEILPLLGLFALTFIGNGAIPLPVTAYVLWMGQFGFPLPVILIGTLGTVLGWVFLSRKWGRRFEHTLFVNPLMGQMANLPDTYRKLFLSRPGISVFLFNAVPLPWDPMRFLALGSEYAPTKLVAALAFGRLVRYSLLVSMGAALTRYQPLFLSFLGLFLFMPLAVKLWQRVSA